MAEKFFIVKNGLKVYADTTIDSDLNVAGSITGNSLIGNYSGFDSDLAQKTTDNLTEGSNLYYTTARFDSDFGDNTTADLTEGTNKYYTKVRVDSDIDLRLVSDPTIAGRVFYDQTGGSVAIGEDTTLGDSSQSVLSFASDSANATAVLAVGIKTQFNHGIGVTGNAASNDMIIGFEGTNTELKIKNNIGTGPFDLSGGTDLLVVGTDGVTNFTNTS